MLPYCQRPPTFVTKEIKAKKEQSKADALLLGGGPIQRAMEIDLMDERPKFEEKLLNLSNNTNGKHCSQGTVFQLFGQVFREAKVALVHTRTVPPRCNREAYSQMLYAACLSLLKKSFEADTLDLKDAAYCVFCLFALYETNPLPTEPASPLQMLPMGVHCPENPKTLYRREFRLPVRIDRLHYALLQRMRDEALRQQAECQSLRMEAIVVNKDDWTCSCGVAPDVVQVIDRLWNHLDLSEYTGPRSLEGLVGHADYPYGCTPQAKNDLPTIHSNPLLTDRELDGMVEVPQEPIETLAESVERYQSSLQRIRFAPSTAEASYQAMQIRDALKPVYSEPSWQDVWMGISATDRTGETQDHRQQPDTLQGIGLISRSQANGAIQVPTHEPTSAGPAIQEDRGGISYELVMPADIPQSQQQGIREALKGLITSGEPLLQPPKSKKSTDISKQNVKAMTANGYEPSVLSIMDVPLDETSTQADGGGAESVFSTVTCGVRAAFNTLLALSAEDTPETVSVAFVQRGQPAMGSSYLASDLNQAFAPAVESDHSAITEESSSDESIGKIAKTLDERAVRAFTTAAGRKTHARLLNRKRKASPNKANSKEEDAKRRARDVDESIRPGKSALDFLLSQAELSEGTEDEGDAGVNVD